MEHSCAAMGNASYLLTVVMRMYSQQSSVHVCFISWFMIMYCVLLLQFHVQVVHFDAVLMDGVSLSLVDVMVLENALMAVMRLDVVSNHSGWAIIITAIAYRIEVNWFSLMCEL